MTKPVEFIKERVYVGAIMASYVTSSVAVVIAFCVGLVTVIALLSQSPDWCWLIWGVVVGVVAVFAGCIVFGFLGGLLGAITGGIGAGLQLLTHRKTVAFPGAAILGAAVGWLTWIGLDALFAWGLNGDDVWRAAARQVAESPLTAGIGTGASMLVGLIGGVAGAFQVLLFQEVFDQKPRTKAAPRATPPTPES